MINSISSSLIGRNSKDQQIIKILCSAFEGNQRIQSLVKKDTQDFKQALNILISYCYFMVKKVGGISTSSDNDACLLYYINSKKYMNLRDYLHYAYLAIKVIGFTRLKKVYQREKFIKSIRKKDQIKNSYSDHIYVWFLAQKKSNKDIKGLIELKRFITKKADELQLPIYMETTDPRLVPLYERMGFQFYTCHQDELAGVNVWFGKYKNNG